MKTTRLLSLAILLVASATYAQEPSKELAKGKSGDMQITGTDTEMYGGTTNEKAMALYEEALGYQRSNELEKAKATYGKVLKEDPKFVEAYDNLGRVHRQLGEMEKAIANYKKSIELYPQGQMARQNLAVVYSMQNDHAAAQEQYTIMLEQRPDEAEGHFGMANSKMQEGEFDAALVHGQRALEIYKGSDSDHLADGHHLVGLIHFYKEDMVAARRELLQAKDLGARIDPRVEKEVFGESSASEELDLSMETPEDYERLAPFVAKAFDWLYQTPVGQETEKRQSINAFLLQWVTGTPMVTIMISEEIVPYAEQIESLVIFMGAYSKHAIHAEKQNNWEATYYATQHVIDFYERNKKELGRNKDIEKLAKLEQENKLKKYIKDNLPKG